MVMIKRCLILSALVLGAAACATQDDFLNSKQDMAIQTAVERGKFELQCRSVTGMVLSREDVDRVSYGPWGGRHGFEHREFTIGVNGCGIRKTYVVTCPERGQGCFAHPGSGRIRGE
jgi:hypothetical protein